EGIGAAAAVAREVLVVVVPRGVAGQRGRRDRDGRTSGRVHEEEVVLLEGAGAIGRGDLEEVGAGSVWRPRERSGRIEREPAGERAGRHRERDRRGAARGGPGGALGGAHCGG